jgi:enoyl-CoA hydratase/carnithine racemase
MWRRLPTILAQVESDPRAKLLVVRGAGGNFAAGADIGEFETVYATRDSTAGYFEAVGAAMEALARLSKPTIAHIEGACVGGGMGLALCCDLRLAASTARMGITPGKLGLSTASPTPSGWWTPWGLGRQGHPVHRQISRRGRRSPSARRRRASGGRAGGGCDREGAGDRGGEPVVGAKSKQVIEMIRAGAAAETPETAAWLLDAVEGADFAEGRDAFLAKRSPIFPSAEDQPWKREGRPAAWSAPPPVQAPSRRPRSAPARTAAVRPRKAHGKRGGRQPEMFPRLVKSAWLAGASPANAKAVCGVAGSSRPA